MRIAPPSPPPHQTETGDKAEGTPGCLREGDDGEVSCSGTRVGESPSNRLGGDHSTGPRQRTGIVAEGGTAHPDDTLGGALQLGWRTGSIDNIPYRVGYIIYAGSPWLLNRCDEEAGREEHSSPTFDLR